MPAARCGCGCRSRGRGDGWIRESVRCTAGAGDHGGGRSNVSYREGLESCRGRYRLAMVGGGIGIRRGVRGIRRRRNLVDLRRQSWRGLGDPPAPIGLLAGFDDRLLRLPPDRYRHRVAGAGRLHRRRLCTGGRRRLGLSRGRRCEIRIGQRLTRPTGQYHRRCHRRDPAHFRLLPSRLKPGASGRCSA